VDECIVAAERAQRLHVEGSWLSARAAALACARDACPQVVRKDCLELFTRLEHDVPSIVVVARDGDGQDVSDVRLFLDDAPVTENLSGRPLDVDPGEHRLRWRDAAGRVGQARLVARAGEKSRLVVVPLVAPPAPVRPSRDVPRDATAPPPRPPTVAPLALALGAVSVVGFTGFGFLGLTASSDLDAMRSSCAPECRSDAVSRARTKAVVADISLGVGLVALAAAVWAQLVTPRTHRARAE
jgi:hypothetical protein